MIKAVVFDMDDTLYAELDYCKSGFRAIADFLSKNPKMPPPDRIFEALYHEFTNGDRSSVFDNALKKLTIDHNAAFIEGLVRIYREHKPDISLPADSKKVLEKLANEYTLALLTDGFMPAQRLKVQALDIEKYFSCIVYTEGLGGKKFWKPSPAGLQTIINTIQIDPKNIAYIADNAKKDFIAPNNLGAITIQLIRPSRIHTKESPEPAAAPQHIIHKISQLPALLRKF